MHSDSTPEQSSSLSLPSCWGVGGILSFTAGRTLLAGVCFLRQRVAIYRRETRA